jgi:hypothetical protein
VDKLCLQVLAERLDQSPDAFRFISPLKIVQRFGNRGNPLPGQGFVPTLVGQKRQPGLVDSLLQEIALGAREPESAWKDAVVKIESAVNGWKTSHPGWQVKGCQ